MALAIVRGSSYGKTGLAACKKTKDGWDVAFKDDNTLHKIMDEDAPENMQALECFISLDEHNIKIMSVRPPSKAYYGYFSGFYAKDGELPVYRNIKYQPRTPKRDWDIPEHLETTAQFKIVEDKNWDGWIIGKPLVYCFVDYMNSGVAALNGYGSKKMEGFLEQLGFDFMKDTIPHSENVLPILQDILREKNKKLILTVGKGGWLNDIVEAP